MKSLRFAWALAAFAIAFGSGGVAHADGDHGKEPSREHSLRHSGDRDHQRWHRHWRPRIGATVFVGPVYRGPYVYTPYYFPPVVTLPLPSPPPVYIEREATAVPAPALTPTANYWYYCENPAGYYPYVIECPGGWKAVAPPPG